jgi:holo-[acyl-carrier protein] synthase
MEHFESREKFYIRNTKAPSTLPGMVAGEKSIMILGVGIDITEIQKIEESIRSETFQQRVFTPVELKAVDGFKNKAEHLAGKFAAKEAFMKAIGAGIWQQVWFAQIEVLNDEFGKPYINVSGEAEVRLKEGKSEKIHVSISHSGGMAVAVVILES